MSTFTMSTASLEFANDVLRVLEPAQFAAEIRDEHVDNVRRKGAFHNHLYPVRLLDVPDDRTVDPDSPNAEFGLGVRQQLVLNRRSIQDTKQLDVRGHPVLRG